MSEATIGFEDPFEYAPVEDPIEEPHRWLNVKVVGNGMMLEETHHKTDKKGRHHAAQRVRVYNNHDEMIRDLGRWVSKYFPKPKEDTWA